MTPTDLARARVQVADVVRLLNRRLNQHGYYPSAALLTTIAMDIAEELARERAQEQEQTEEQPK